MSEETKMELPKCPKELENFLFLGLPEAGKTTYFTVMAKTLQNLAAKGDEIKFRFENDDTREFIQAGWDVLTAPEPDWPDKTITCSEYEVSLLQRINILGYRLPWRFGYRQASVRCHGYPGEVYAAAFGKAANDSFREMAETMRQQVRNAKGVFLLLDAERLFNGYDRKAMEETTEHLFRFILENNPKVKLAILFNKLELFEGMVTEMNFREMFRDRYSAAYSFLPQKVRFFDVYPVGKLDVDENGHKIPARPLATHGVIEPVQWMIGFRGRFENESLH